MSSPYKMRPLVVRFWPTAAAERFTFITARDDSVAQLACDHPDAAQDYRLAICGNGDPEVCRETFPYVVARADAIERESYFGA